MSEPRTIVLESSSGHLHGLIRQLIVLPYEAFITLWAFLLFELFMILMLPIAWLHARLHPAHSERAWSEVAQGFFRMYLYVAGVRLVVEHSEYLPQSGQSVVFAANHASLVDGLLWGAVFRAPIVALILPPGHIIWPMDLWLTKAGSLPIARNPEERTRFPKLVWGEKAVGAAAKTVMTRRTSLLVFPEGHVERTRRVQRFHTGAVRIALRAGVPLVPLTIRGAERVFSPNRFTMWPGTITIRVHPPFDLTPYYGKQRNRALVRQLTERLRRVIVRDLPETYTTTPTT
ncbi:1-acyl-sn-glycerol-3-phosphate acyltransferase [Candidatus Berkelbacteria bacterium]|nr:1-acyl-sn-glycerol-3-phosphate acyltransferase [Candidatus Berkelbacteria bacterium]